MNYEIRNLPKEEWPSGLAEIPDASKSLRIAGTLRPENINLCVVGARKHTSYGAEMASRLISSLAGQSVTIISGMAIGIDSFVHRAALKAGLHTIAFPGSGLAREVIYPRRNLVLAEEILSAGGALVSEYPDDFRPTLWSFPRRNRLMAGSSRAVLLIEAEKKSGTLITARLATEYNRDVLALPGNISSPLSSGPNMLIRLGATPITCEDDLFEALGLSREERETGDKYDELSSEEMAVVEFLKEPLTRDDLCTRCNMPMNEVSVLLSMLEIKGIIYESGGKIGLL